MSSNITDLFGGGTTETISNTGGGPTILPSTDVINLTRQIIAINEDPTLTPEQKQQQIDALQGISYNAVNTNPTVNIQGVGQISNTVTPPSVIDQVLQNLYSQLAQPSDNPLNNIPAFTPPIGAGVSNTNVDPSVQNPVSSPSPVNSTPSTNSGMFTNIENFLKQNTLFILIGIVFLLIMLSRRPSQRMTYLSPQIREQMR